METRLYRKKRKRSESRDSDIESRIFKGKRSKTRSSIHINELPAEILVHAFTFLRSKDLALAASLVCKLWYVSAKENVIWRRLTRLELGVNVLINSKHSSIINRSHWKQSFIALRQQDFTPSYQDEEKLHLGCKHYKRGCKILADCCNKFFPCRLCHDETSNHKIDRYATKEMMCMKCNTIQPVAQTCANKDCAWQIAHYYCDVCKLWDNQEGKSIYHCNHCRICRVGKGLDIDYWHCNKCGVCFSIKVKNTHQCKVTNCLKTKCPGCTSEEWMFYSREPIALLRCGHAMHSVCFESMYRRSHLCPTCRTPFRDPQQQQLAPAAAGNPGPHYGHHHHHGHHAPHYGHHHLGHHHHGHHHHGHHAQHHLLPQHAVQAAQPINPITYLGHNMAPFGHVQHHGPHHGHHGHGHHGHIIMPTGQSYPHASDYIGEQVTPAPQHNIIMSDDSDVSESMSSSLSSDESWTDEFSDSLSDSESNDEVDAPDVTSHGHHTHHMHHGHAHHMHFNLRPSGHRSESSSESSSDDED